MLIYFAIHAVPCKHKVKFGSLINSYRIMAGLVLKALRLGSPHPERLLCVKHKPQTVGLGGRRAVASLGAPGPAYLAAEPRCGALGKANPWQLIKGSGNSLSSARAVGAGRVSGLGRVTRNWNQPRCPDGRKAGRL